MRRKWVYALLAAILVLGAAAAVMIGVGRERAERAAESEAAKPVAPPPEISLPGRIQAIEVVNVPAPVSGEISAFHVEPGADVYEGQLLAEVRDRFTEINAQTVMSEVERLQQRVNTLEGTLAASRLEASRATADALRARSELERATRTYERQRLLLAEGATPRLVYEKAEREYRALESESGHLNEAAEIAQQRVETMQRDLDAARKLLEGQIADLEAANARVQAGQVLSPATGVIAGRRGEVGASVNPAMEDLFVIATDLSRLNLIVEPDPSQVARIAPGQVASVVVADIPEPLPGLVSSIDDGTVTIEFANPSPVVRPGMTAHVRISTN